MPTGGRPPHRAGLTAWSQAEGLRGQALLPAELTRTCVGRRGCCPQGGEGGRCQPRCGPPSTCPEHVLQGQGWSSRRPPTHTHADVPTAPSPTGRQPASAHGCLRRPFYPGVPMTSLPRGRGDGEDETSWGCGGEERPRSPAHCCVTSGGSLNPSERPSSALPRPFRRCVSVHGGPGASRERRVPSCTISATASPPGAQQECSAWTPAKRAGRVPRIKSRGPCPPTKSP